MLRRSMILVLSLASTALAQQGTISLAVGLGPSGFGTTSTTTCGTTTLTSLNNVVRTEPLVITLQSSPTHVTPPPLIPIPRRVALFVGVKDCSGFVSFGGSFVFLSIPGPPPAVILFDSFTNPFDPVFGPPVLGPSFINVVIGADFFGPLGNSPLVLQAITEDLPNTATPFLLSNPVELNIINPNQASGFGPSLGAITSNAPPCSSSGGPGGPETGGTTITLTGTNFPVQTNWIQYPPTVLVGGTPATGVAILSSTTATAVTQATSPSTCPPGTPAGPQSVSFRNNNLISPGAMTVSSATKFTYCSGRTPASTLLTPSSTLPEGGNLLTISGTDFLHGADVIFTSQSAANLTTTISPPDAAFASTGPCGAPTPTTITLTTPPFCAGLVSVKVVNPDGVASTATIQTLNYVPQTANATSAAPTVAIPGLVTPPNLAVMTASGGAINVFGTDFIGPSSALFNSPTVPQSPAMLYPSRTEILEPLSFNTLFSSPPGASGVTAPNAISLTPAISVQAGEFRPSLGVKWLRVVNCPCADPGPIMPPPLHAVKILVQDGAPPTVTGLFPNVITPAGPGGAIASKVIITGSNFFARLPSQTLPVNQSFTSTAPPMLEDLKVPAVSFGGLFSRSVDLISQTEIRAEIPEGIAPQPSVTINVYNPDGRSATSSTTIRVVPRLTDPTQIALQHVSPAGTLPVLDLDAAALLSITNLATNPFVMDEALLFVSNPTATDDRLEDIANGGDPLVTSNPSAYDGIFLFNTRQQPSGQMRLFDFRRIDVPATITLPAPLSVPGGTVTAGIKRVIFKASSFFDPLMLNVSPYLFVDENYPLVLRSHDDFTFSGLMDLSGDSLAAQSVASSPTLKFHFRCEWQLPPAGGGIGGRGGVHFPGALLDHDPSAASEILILPPLLASMPQANLGTTAIMLTGSPGYPPRKRTPVTPDPLTYGRFGLGRAPFGGLAGAGGGGGHAGPGGSGQAGATASAALGGNLFGNNSTLPVGTPGRPDLDAYIYGDSTAMSDFDGPLGLSTAAFPHGLFAGGSGGGGGGGSLAVVIPCVSLGGRGGNGGGSAVLLSDRIFKLGTYGRILTDGERGQLGIDAFPLVNGEPLFVLCAPGSGGGGAGGSIFIAAVADADLTAAAVFPMQHILGADGGLGGAPTGTATVTTAHGGAGGAGRIRIAINEHSSMVLTRQSDFIMRATNGNISPSPGTSLPNAFFKYPSP